LTFGKSSPFFLVVVVLFLFGRWLSHSTRDIRSPGETLDGLLAALSYYFFFSLSPISEKSQPRDIVLKDPTLRSFTELFKDVFFKPSSSCDPPKSGLRAIRFEAQEKPQQQQQK
jgi:hypothetical protein